MAKQMMDIGVTPIIVDGQEVGVDLLVVNGDFVITESTGRHMTELILNNKGDFKENPTICVGAVNYLDDENQGDLIRAISVEFTRDGADVKSVVMGTDNVIRTDAFYK